MYFRNCTDHLLRWFLRASENADAALVKYALSVGYDTCPAHVSTKAGAEKHLLRASRLQARSPIPHEPLRPPCGARSVQERADLGLELLLFFGVKAGVHEAHDARRVDHVRGRHGGRLITLGSDLTVVPRQGKGGSRFLRELRNACRVFVDAD